MARPYIFFCLWLMLLALSGSLSAQDETYCDEELIGRRSVSLYQKAEKAYFGGEISESIRLLNKSIDADPNNPAPHYLLGLIYISERRMNLKAAADLFETTVEFCPGYNVYAWFHLARIAYGAEDFEKTVQYIEHFLEDVDRIKSDQDYEDAVKLYENASFYTDMMNNPVPFDPTPVEGISTADDEYLAIISPDNELALFTRRMELPPSRNSIVPRSRMVEKFMYSERLNGKFHEGSEMEAPFNRYENEGGATVTIDNKTLYYTLCRYREDKSYYNCDICVSQKNNGQWSEIENLGDTVNRKDAWESQPSVTSDGNTLFFVSDRPGGFGGYDIYSATKDEEGRWQTPVNLGSRINTAGNEKAPFIHTDSKTLYFSSDGRMGMGGYDIYYSKLKTDSSWTEPVNIGFPINSLYDDVGLFVSTDGRYGYFASNKFEGKGGWDLFYFDLYKEARPQKVLFVKGSVENDGNGDIADTRVELKNVETKQVTHIPVDSTSGDYVAAVLFRNDYILTVKKRGYAYQTRYISRIDPRYSAPVKIDMELEPIEVGKSYRLDDVYFDFNSFELTQEGKAVIDELYQFLVDNPEIEIIIQGHTDDIGNDEDNLILSENRSKAVYDYLSVKGIDRQRIDYKGFGESMPVASNQTEEGRALNRRTEFVVVEK